MGKLIYLDNAATTKTAPEVVDAMLPYFTEHFGNPSSVYGFAAANKEVITKQREIIAKALGAKTEEIYFTAGGSESDNWALKATAEAYESKGKHIITTKIEHHAILHTCEYLEKERGAKITYLDVDENGIVKLDELERVMKNAPGQKVIYVIPNFQNPTGSTMSFEKRKGIYELACKYNGVIIEDNPYGDLRFAGESVPSIKSLDKEGRVIYVGSFSKILAPGLRDGCLQAGVRRSHKHLAAACML